MDRKFQHHPQPPRGKILFAPFKHGFQSAKQETYDLLWMALVVTLSSICGEMSEQILELNSLYFWECAGLTLCNVFLSVFIFKKFYRQNQWLLAIFVALFGIIFLILVATELYRFL